MKSSTKRGLLGSIFSFILAPALAQTSAPEEARLAAVKSIETLRNYVASKSQSKDSDWSKGLDIKALGFDAPGQAPEASVGDPFQDYIVGLSDLKSWDGTDPMKLLHPTGRLIYPINTKGEAQSSVTVAKTGDQWTSVAFGSSQDARSRSFIRKSLTQAPGSASVANMQVRVPTLHVTFVGQQVGGQLQFTPMASVPNLGLEMGKTELARDVLLRIQPAARELNPDDLN